MPASHHDIPLLGILLPCYNEEEILPINIPRLLSKMESLLSRQLIRPESYLVFIDDGSRDATWSIIREASLSHPIVKAVKLSRNFGHQSAILSGLMHFRSKADCLITMDVDLQDDISVIDEMIAHYRQGCEIVYGVRAERDTDRIFKRETAHFFYSLMLKMGVSIIYNHSDFRLTSSRALHELARYGETNLFLRGIYPLLGFKTAQVSYARLEREAGESKYPLSKMISLAINGITSFSIKPLRIVTIAGIMIFFFSLLLAIWSLYRFAIGAVIPGWTSTVLPIYFLGGIQLLGIGILGEYLGKIYQEVKKRPLYSIEEVLE